jgi:hypothetical protein
MKTAVSLISQQTNLGYAPLVPGALIVCSVGRLDQFGSSVPLNHDGRRRVIAASVTERIAKAVAMWQDKQPNSMPPGIGTVICGPEEIIQYSLASQFGLLFDTKRPIPLEGLRDWCWEDSLSSLSPYISRSTHRGALSYISQMVAATLHQEIWAQQAAVENRQMLNGRGHGRTVLLVVGPTVAWAIISHLEDRHLRTPDAPLWPKTSAYFFNDKGALLSDRPELQLIP